MKRGAVILLVAISFSLSSQPLKEPLELFKQFSIGMGFDEIQYQLSVNLENSPSALVFVDGNTLWIGQVDSAKLFSLRTKSNVAVVPYPYDPQAAIKNGGYLVFSNSEAALRSDHFVSFRILKTIHYI